MDSGACCSILVQLTAQTTNYNPAHIRASIKDKQVQRNAVIDPLWYAIWACLGSGRGVGRAIRLLCLLEFFQFFVRLGCVMLTLCKVKQESLTCKLLLVKVSTMHL